MVEHRTLVDSIQYQYGLHVHHVQELKKDRVYQIETDNGDYVLKLDQDESRLRWQQRSLEQLQEAGCRGIVPYMANHNRDCLNLVNGKMYVLMPYIQGEPLSPHHQHQVFACMKLLANVHHKGRGIYGRTQTIPFESHILTKWTERYQWFVQSLQDIEQVDADRESSIHMMQWLGHEMSEWAQQALDFLSPAYMLYLEEQAQWERQISHLDVVFHNFIVKNNDTYYIVDYDLLDYAPPFLDVLQYTQQLLPYYDWSFAFLQTLVEHYEQAAAQRHLPYEMFYASLIYPHDIIKEWLGVWRRQSGFHPQRLFQYLHENMEKWEARRKFVQQCKTMLK